MIKDLEFNFSQSKNEDFLTEIIIRGKKIISTKGFCNYHDLQDILLKSLTEYERKMLVVMLNLIHIKSYETLKVLLPIVQNVKHNIKEEK